MALGSIAELPAAGCEEIKMSEGQVLASKKYWMICMNQDMAVLAYCNMTTGGELNCWRAFASQHANLYNSGKCHNLSDVRLEACAIDCFFIIRGIHTCAMTSGKTCMWTRSRDSK